MFGVTEAQAAMVMLKGFELGMGMAASFDFIHTIEGRPSISPKGALALIHRSGELAGMKIQNLTDPDGAPTRCKVWMKRTNGVEHETEFSMDDARRAGLVKPKGSWEMYPANMLQWRAVGYCADVVFPDICGGLYRPEELGGVVDAEGEPVISEGETAISEGDGGWTEAQYTPAPAPPGTTESVPATPTLPTPAAEKSAATITVNDILVAGFTAEEIMVANEGRIPATSKECEDILRALKEARDAAH